MSISSVNVIPSGLLSTTQYNSLSQAQQTAATAAQKQVDSQLSILSSLSGSAAGSSLNSIGVSGSDQTAASLSANSILSDLANTGDSLPSGIYQYNLLESLIRQPSTTGSNQASSALQSYSKDLTGSAPAGSTLNIQA